MPDGESFTERAVFDRLYREQGLPVRRFLQLWLPNSAGADDLTQETFPHFWRRRSAFDPDSGRHSNLFVRDCTLEGRGLAPSPKGW